MKISVIMAVYNSEKYLQQAIESVLNQTLQDIELICVDDGSTDRSMEILQRYASQDKRVTVLQQTESTDGAAAARNLGIRHATGEFLSILDSDDFFEPDMLEKAYQLATTTSADVVIYDGVLYDDQTFTERNAGFILHKEYLLEEKKVFSPGEYADVLFLLTLGAAWNCLFRRGFIERNEIVFQSYHHADDLGFVYLAFACAEKISVLDEKLVHYRRNQAASQAANIDKWPDTACAALLSLKEELMKRGLYELYRKAFVQKAMEYVLFYLNEMKSAESYIHLYESIQKTYLEKLDVLSLDKDEFAVPYWGEMRDVLLHLSPEECLFRQVKGIKPFQGILERQMLLPAHTKVAVYGAGTAGTDVVCEILRKHTVTLSVWVDKAYHRLGYPIKEPQILKETEFDYVLIAIIAHSVYESVKAYLLKLGIPKEKIRWIGTGY